MATNEKKPLKIFGNPKRDWQRFPDPFCFP